MDYPLGSPQSEDPELLDPKYDSDNPQDLSLPRTMVQRLAKGVLPPQTLLGKDAIMAISKSATLFVNHLAHQYVYSSYPSITHCHNISHCAWHKISPSFRLPLELIYGICENRASQSPANGNKRTIPPTAVIEALIDLEFENFVPRVEAELQKHIELQTGKRNEYRARIKEQQKPGDMKGGERGDVMGSSSIDGDGDGEEGRAAKRVRRADGEGSMSEGVDLNGIGDGHEQLVVDLDEDEAGEEEDGMEYQDNETSRRRQGEEGEDEEGEEGDEEEDDDEDEFPDEGRRLSSVEREDHEGPYRRSPGRDGQDTSGNEEGLSDVSD